MVDQDIIESNSKGISDTSWDIVNESKGTVELIIKYREPPPEFVRLINPGGTEVWRQENPQREDRVTFTVPIKAEGEWTLASTNEKETESLTLVFNRDLRFNNISLNIDDITVSASNRGSVPTRWVSYIINTGRHAEAMEVGELLLPGESYEITHEYPFNKYQGVKFHLFDGQDTYDKTTVDLV